MSQKTNNDDRREHSLTAKLNDPTPRPVDITCEWDTTVESTSQKVGTLPSFPGYTVLRPLVSGGMGSILEAMDNSLNRPVAIKTMLPGMNKQRFINESILAARFPHPSIPPVHSLGSLSDGTPYFVMKLIQGETLATLLSRRNNPGEELPRFIAIFEQIAQAIGFVHSHRVIHRDIKPPNIMVGAFGEVQVMDWGLAKQLGESNLKYEADELESANSDPPTNLADNGLTLAGEIMGTPSYLAPEQARGETVDERADVFALGCILCDILTGSPPFLGKGGLDTVKIAASGDVSAAFARLDRSEVDPDLIAIAKRCLAPSPSDRYCNGSQVYDCVSQFRDNVEQKLRQSESARRAEAVRALELAKRRRLSRVFAFVALLLLGMTAYLYRQRELGQIQQWAELSKIQSERTQERELATSKALTLAISDLANARNSLKNNKLELATATAAQAESRVSGEFPADVANQISRLRTDLEIVQLLNQIRDRAWTVVNFSYENEKSRAAYPSVFARLGVDIFVDQAEDVAEVLKTSAIIDRLVAALDEWLSIASEDQRPKLMHLLRLLDSDGTRSQIREALYGNRLVELAHQLIKDLDVANHSPAFLASLAFHASLPIADRRNLLLRAWELYTDDFLLALSLAVSYGREYPNNWHRSAEFGRAVLAIDPYSAVAWNNLGNALRELKQYDDALAAFRKAVEIAPDVPSHHNGLGAILRDQGELDAALEEYTKAIELQPDDAGHLNGVGIVYQSMGQIPQAEEAFLKAIRLSPTWDSPLNNYALLQRSEADWNTFDSKLELIAQSLDGKVREELCLAVSYKHLHVSKRRQSQITWLERAAQLDPEDRRIWHSLAYAYSEEKRHNEAISAARRAIECEGPDQATHIGVLGFVLIEAGQHEEGLTAIRRNTQMKPSPQAAFHKLPIVLKTYDVLFALELYETAKKGTTVPSTVLLQLIQALIDSGYYESAIQVIDEAMTTRPDLLSNNSFTTEVAKLQIKLGFRETQLNPTTAKAQRDKAATWLSTRHNWAKFQVEYATKDRAQAIESGLKSLFEDPGISCTRDEQVLSRIDESERVRWNQLWSDLQLIRHHCQLH